MEFNFNDFKEGFVYGFWKGICNGASIVMSLVFIGGFLLWPAYNSYTFLVGLFLLTIAVLFHITSEVCKDLKGKKDVLRHMLLVMEWMCWGKHSSLCEETDGFPKKATVNTWYHILFLILFNSVLTITMAKIALILPWQSLQTQGILWSLISVVYFLVAMNLSICVTQGYKDKYKKKSVPVKMKMKFLGLSLFWPVVMATDLEDTFLKKYW